MAYAQTLTRPQDAALSIADPAYIAERIAALKAAQSDPINYAAEWLDQIAAAGAYAYQFTDHQGRPGFAVGYAFDSMWQARRRYVDALCAHLYRSGHRDFVAATVS